MIKMLAREGHGQTITLNKIYSQTANARLCPIQHGSGKIQARINLTWREMGQIQTGTDAIDKNVQAALPRQLPETSRTHPRGCGCEQSIVKWSDNCVGMT